MNLAHGLTPEHKPEKVNVFVNEAIRASFEGFNWENINHKNIIIIIFINVQSIL